MLSRARLEALLRIIAMAALVAAVAVAFAALWGTHGRRVTARALPRMLREWSAVTAPSRIHLRLDSLPSASDLAWVAAVGGAGSSITWDADDSIAPTALTNEPLPDPRRPVRVTAVGAPKARFELQDVAGAIDSFALGPDGVAQLILPGSTGRLSLAEARATSSTPARDSLLLRSIVVLGTASWESKFIIASLEEEGWNVVARLGLSPAEAVTQGPATIQFDTANTSAVIAVDTSASRYAAQITRYVRSGGGLVLLSAASDVVGLGALLPAHPAIDPIEGAPFGSDTLSPRASLAFRPLMRLASDASVLDRRDGEVAIAIRRAGEGRVLQVGYVETWRWRMAARGDSALADYRRWWSRMTGTVAYAPRVARGGEIDTIARDPAPLAALVDRLGPPSAATAIAGASLLDPRLLPWLFGIAVISLLLEWLSRRLRGRP